MEKEKIVEEAKKDIAIMVVENHGKACTIRQGSLDRP